MAFDSGLTDIKIANRALRNIGSRVQITSLSATDTTEAILCNDFFAECRDRVLREIDWNFASKFADLAGKVDGSDTAGDGTNVEADWRRFWAFSYTFPDDCLALREFVTQDGRQPASKLPHDIITDTAVLKIVCDIDSADDDVTIRYTYRNTTYSTWWIDAGAAFAMLLAATIAKPLTGDEDRALKLMQQYEFLRNKGTGAVRNERIPDTDADGPFITARR